MNTKFLHLTTLGFAAVGTAFSLTVLDAATPIQLLNPLSSSAHQALAQSAPSPTPASPLPSPAPERSTPSPTPGRSTPGPAQSAPSATPGKPSARVKLDNVPVQGKLDSSSNVLPSDNSYFNTYTFEGKAGQLVVIGMNSREFSPYLALLTPDGKDLAQGDSKGGSDARVVASLPADGTYTVLANSAQPRQTGNYSLRLTTAEQGKVLLQEQGAIGSSSPVLQDGSHYQEYRFQGTSGQTVTISMESREFTPFLLVIDSNNKEIGESKDGASSNSASSLTVTFPNTGTYRVLANSFDRSGQGRFTLTVHEVKVPELRP